jgi:hypothetical protein
VNHKNRIIWIEDKSDLNPSSSAALPNYIESRSANLFGIGRLSAAHNRFGFFRRDAVLGNMVDIPINPSKDRMPPHHLIMEESHK